jgi:hypothetical protein
MSDSRPVGPRTVLPTGLDDRRPLLRPRAGFIRKPGNVAVRLSAYRSKLKTSFVLRHGRPREIGSPRDCNARAGFPPSFELFGGEVVEQRDSPFLQARG